MKKYLVKIAGAALVMMSTIASADAATKFTIVEPTIPSSVTGTVPLRLDLCARWGVDCGLPAVHQYCRSFHGADGIDFQIDQNVGARTPTRTILSGQTCAAGFCDSFKSITCQKKWKVDTFYEACSSTAVFPNRNVNSVREVQFGTKAPRRANGIIEVQNGGVVLGRNDRNFYEIDLQPNQRSVNFFCLKRGTWHKEVFRCDKTADIIHLGRHNGGGRKIWMRCFK